MALTVSETGAGARIAVETVLSTTPNNDIFGVIITLKTITAANASAQVVYVKLYDALFVDVANLPAPNHVWMVPANATIRLSFETAGWTFLTGLTSRCVQNNGTPGVTAPSANVAVTLTVE